MPRKDFYSGSGHGIASRPYPRPYASSLRPACRPGYGRPYGTVVTETETESGGHLYGASIEETESETFRTGHAQGGRCFIDTKDGGCVIGAVVFEDVSYVIDTVVFARLQAAKDCGCG